MWEAWVWYLGWEEPLEEGMATHSSILAWRIPTDRGAWWAACSPWGHKESDMTEHLSTYGKKKIQGIEKGKKSKDTESEEAGMENGMKEILLKHHRDFPGGTVVKNLPCKKKRENLPCNAGDKCSIPGRGTRPPMPCCSVTKLCLTLCDPIDCSTPGFPVLHHLPEFAEIHVHWVSDAPTVSSSVVPFSSCLQSFPASGSFPMSPNFASGGWTCVGVLSPCATMEDPVCCSYNRQINKYF